MALPNDPFTQIGNAAQPNTDLPSPAFPSLVRIQPSDMVGPVAGNRQEASLEKRTETLRIQLNKVIDFLNIVDETFLRKTNAAAKDGFTGPTANVSWNGKKLYDLAEQVIANGSDYAVTGNQLYDEQQARISGDDALDALITALTTRVSATEIRVCLPGMLAAFDSLTTPSGWLLCDGRRFTSAGYYAKDSGTLVPYGSIDWNDLKPLRDHYAATGYIRGGSPSNIYIPDYRGRAIIGAGNNTDPGISNREVGDEGGAETHVLSAGELPPHTHRIPLYDEGEDDSGGSGQATIRQHSLSSGSYVSDAGPGDSDPHNTMMPFGVGRVCIAYR